MRSPPEPNEPKEQRIKAELSKEEYSPPNRWNKYRTYDAKQEAAYREMLVAREGET